MAVENELMQKAGAWYSYDGNRVGQGRDNVRQYLKDHPEIVEVLEEKIRGIYLATEVPQESTEEVVTEE